MTFLPIVARELRVLSRRKSTFTARISSAIISALLGSYAYLMATQFGGRGGRGVFSFLTWFGFIYCLISGLRNASDSISEEKREGTLGLLFLTDLKGYDVVFGKLCATALNSFYGLLAAYPVLGTVLILGGVSGLEFWRMILALLNAFFFAHATALMISTFSRHSRKAFGGALCVALLFLAGIPTIYGLLKYYLPSLTFAWILPLFSPWYPFDKATAVGLRHTYFWTSLGLTHLVGWSFLAIASLALPRIWQDKAATVREVRWKERRQQWAYGGAAVRLAFRRRLMQINPFHSHPKMPENGGRMPQIPQKV